MPHPIKLFIDAASRHAEDSDEPDHEVGDLQDMLRVAHGLLTEEQRIEFEAHFQVQNVMLNGA